MKKTIFLLAAAALCGTASATILRVNNVAGNSAPYTTITAALAAAAIGDTIMVEQSSTTYGDLTITKKVVLMGPGYWLAENGVSAEGSTCSKVGAVTVNSEAAGTIIHGMWIEGVLTIDAPNTVVSRCNTRNAIDIAGNATNCVFHQNFMYRNKNKKNIGGKSDTEYANYTQITNNIIIQSDGIFPTSPIIYLNEAYIANNTFAFFSLDNYGTKTGIASCTNCTIERNVGQSLGAIAGCSYVDNCIYSKWIYGDRSTDRTIKEEIAIDADIANEIAAKNAGAFNGDDPYVISGLPAGPVIEDITVPATVEKGQPLNITIKLGIQK